MPMAEKTDIALADEEVLLDKLKTEFEDFITNTQTARDASDRDRHYVDHIQWDAEEEQILRDRGQAPIVINRIKKKVNFLIGVNENTQTDPKAFPRTPKHEQGSEAITDALRFVADNVDFDDVDSDVFEDRIVEGYGGAIVRVEENGEGEANVGG